MTTSNTTTESRDKRSGIGRNPADDPVNIEQTLLANVERDYMTGCLRWTGSHSAQGYGQITLRALTPKHHVRVHRAAYELWVGPIPEGYEVDHVHAWGCRHRDCVEPTHLEAVTHAENTRRARALITHCRQGHEFSEANTMISGRGARRCRACCREWNRQSRAKARRVVVLGEAA